MRLLSSGSIVLKEKIIEISCMIIQFYYFCTDEKNNRI